MRHDAFKTVRLWENKQKKKKMMHVDEIHERAERMQSHRGRTIGSEPGYM